MPRYDFWLTYMYIALLIWQSQSFWFNGCVTCMQVLSGVRIVLIIADQHKWWAQKSPGRAVSRQAVRRGRVLRTEEGMVQTWGHIMAPAWGHITILTWDHMIQAWGYIMVPTWGHMIQAWGYIMVPAWGHMTLQTRDYIFLCMLRVYMLKLFPWPCWQFNRTTIYQINKGYNVYNFAKEIRRHSQMIKDCLQIRSHQMY